MRIAVSEVKAGSILAAPAVGPGGRQLALVGSVLTVQHLIVLKAWGIASVEITVDNTSAPDSKAAADKAARLAAQRIVAARFRGQPTDHPAIRALFAAAVVRQLQMNAGA